MENKLKRCPFCGCDTGELYIVMLSMYYNDTLGIFCNGCKQTVILEENEEDGDSEKARRKAIDAWNRRCNDGKVNI